MMGLEKLRFGISCKIFLMRFQIVYLASRDFEHDVFINLLKIYKNNSIHMNKKTIC